MVTQWGGACLQEVSHTITSRGLSAIAEFLVYIIGKLCERDCTAADVNLHIV